MSAPNAHLETFIVTAVTAIVDLRGGSSVALMEGNVVPANVKPSHLDHLLELGIVEQREIVGGLR